MMDSRFKDTTPEMMLSHLIEECGEVIAAAGKLQRWGPDSYNPLLPPMERETNRTWLKREMVDLAKVLVQMHDNIDKL